MPMTAGQDETDGFLNLTILLKSLAQGIIIGVPRQPAKRNRNNH
jgi:hypothetical protein